MGAIRARANENTLWVSSLAPPTAAVSFEQGFLVNYRRIRQLVQELERPGVLLVALSDRGIRGTAFLTQREGTIQAAILGRHTEADLHLGGDPSVSLRHLCLIVHPRGLTEQLRFRLADLRTVQGFRDEGGRRRRAIEADGTLFVRCGGYRLLVFPLAGDRNRDWPDDPRAGWEAIPERVYYDESEATERRLREVSASEQTLVEGRPSPTLVTEPLVRSGEDVLGELRIDSRSGKKNYRLGRSAARAGVILGRASRCEAEGVLKDRHISRVHLLVMEVAGRLYAIDAASLNGVWSEEPERRVWPLSDGSRLSLCGRARVVWRER